MTIVMRRVERGKGVITMLATLHEFFELEAGKTARTLVEDTKLSNAYRTCIEAIG